jgi:transglutaminase-like putative cysteine protease
MLTTATATATASADLAPRACNPTVTPGGVSSGGATPAPPNAGDFTQRAILPATPVAQTFDIDCTLEYAVNGPTDFVFQIHAHDGMDQQVLSESLVITPDLPQHVYADPTIGHRFLRLHADNGPLTLRYQARVRRTVQPLDPQAEELPIAELPDDLLHNLNPTRYCESDHLSQTAQTLFGQLPRGLSRVQAIVDWIGQNITYQIGTSDATTTARDVLTQGAGVCRDFAHLGVTFCRALNIPARLVVGYARFGEPPPDFHAVFEAYLGGRWVQFDATHMSPIDDLVRVATGRDAKDVAFATIYGPATMLSMAPLITKIGTSG